MNQHRASILFFVISATLTGFLGGLAVAAPVLKIGVLQIEDVAPLYVAEQEGHFSNEGIAVELVPFLSALERDSALAAGAIDGAINDPIGALLFDQGRNLLRITSLGLGKTPAEGPFAILAAPRSNIQTIDDLKNVEIAVSTATIIEYVTDRLLEKHGFQPEEIRKIDVKKMPIRMQMLLSGAVQAATLPEPLATIAVGNGARPIVSDAETDESLSQTVMVFRQPVLAERCDEITAFFRAYRYAAEAINQAPETYRDLIIRIGGIPPQLAANYPIPTYPLPEPFPRTFYEPVMEWLVAQGLAPVIAYETMVATSCLDAHAP